MNFCACFCCQKFQEDIDLCEFGRGNKKLQNEYDHESITKVVCFNVDGATSFQSITIGVSTQLKKRSSHFYIPMYCVVHGTNLVVFTLFDLSIITKIETLLVGVYAYFNHSVKMKCWKLEIDQLDGDKRFQDFAILLKFNGLTWLF